MKRSRFGCLLLALALSLAVASQAIASEVARAFATQEAVKIYVRGEDGPDAEAGLLLGNQKAETVEAHPLGEDAYPMRTLVMLDNSLSIPRELRPAVLELTHSLINSHMEGEQIRLSTFGSQIQYLSDYTEDYGELNNIVSNIQFYDQDTYLTNVLYGVLDDAYFKNYEGYQRIILVADGVDDTLRDVYGKTKDDLSQKLQENMFPIHSVGVPNGRNNQELQNMFALSRMTRSGENRLDGGDFVLIAQRINQDQGIVVYESPLPDSLKTGSEVNAQLRLSNGERLETRFKLPFLEEDGGAGTGEGGGKDSSYDSDPGSGSGSDSDENAGSGSDSGAGSDAQGGSGDGGDADASDSGSGSQRSGDKAEEAEDAEDAGDTESEDTEEAGFFGGILQYVQEHALLCGLIGGGVLLLLLLLLLFLAVRRKKRRKPEEAEQGGSDTDAYPPTMPGVGGMGDPFGDSFGRSSGGSFGSSFGTPPPADGEVDGESPTIYAQDTDPFSGADPSEGAGDLGGSPSYALRLTDVNDGTRVFQRPFAGEVKIGRSSRSCGLVLSYDDSISREQCVIRENGDRFFIENLATTNPTKLNGVLVDTPLEIFSEDQIRMGRVVVRVEFVHL